LSNTDLQAPGKPGAHHSRSAWWHVFIVIFLFLFLIAGCSFGFLFYGTIRELVAELNLPALPVLQLPAFSRSLASGSRASNEPLPQLPDMTSEAGSPVLSYAPPPAPSEGGGRINILLLGIDRRGGQGWNRLTDTIIVVTVDQANRTAGMLSIPRDLQVPIPGNGEDRINTANGKGESQGYPGGGPALLKRTIEANFRIPIHYYIMIDFQGFEKMIDALGGIDVYVAKELTDTQYPDPLPEDPNHFRTIHFDVGWEHMSGARALKYARSRMSTTDFDRAARQQDILVAVREKALSLNLLPRLPALLATMLDSFKTDISWDEIPQLAALAPQIDMSTMKRVVLQKPLVYGYKRADGAAVQLPKWDLIDPVVADLLTSAVIVTEATPTPEPPPPTPTLAPIEIAELQELAREGARIAVQNGTSEPNYAARVAAYLMELGYQVVEFGDADRLDYAKTVIVDYTGKAYTLQRLVQQFQVTPENVRQSPNLRSSIDIRIVVGQDYRLPSP